MNVCITYLQSFKGLFDPKDDLEGNGEASGRVILMFSVSEVVASGGDDGGDIGRLGSNSEISVTGAFADGNKLFPILFSGVSGGEIGKARASFAFLTARSGICRSECTGSDGAARFLDIFSERSVAIDEADRLRLVSFKAEGDLTGISLGLLFLSGGNVRACLRVLGLLDGVVWM